MQLSIGSVLGCMLFLFFTNPERLPVVLTLTVPVLLAALCVGMTRLVCAVFTDMTEVRIRRLSIITGAGVLVVALLGSLGQLGIQDFILSAALVSGVVFYLRRFQTGQ